jgi:hypothetical protein
MRLCYFGGTTLTEYKVDSRDDDSAFVDLSRRQSACPAFRTLIDMAQQSFCFLSTVECVRVCDRKWKDITIDSKKGVSWNIQDEEDSNC